MAALDDKFTLPDDVHFLNRLSFGSTSDSIEEAAAVGWEEVLATQLYPESIDTSELDTLLADEFPSLQMTAKQIVDADDDELFDRLVPDLIISTILRQLHSPAQLYERMVEFWSDHFNVNLVDDRVALFKPTDDRDNIRPNALGKFRDLLYANARSPAMLLYLDNYSNTKQGPNENYARELLELHTLGVDGGYTEEDVVEVARAFTGWSIDPDKLEFRFYLENHDRGNKMVLGNRIKHTYTGGISDGEQILDILASHPSTAQFISGKMIRRFVSDKAHPVLLKKLTQVFIDTDGDIKALMNTIFSSGAFWVNRERKMKRPVDFMVSIARKLGLESNEQLISYFHTRLKQLGQLPFLWHAPNGYPDVAQHWTNTSSLVNRWSVCKDAAAYLPRKNYVAMLSGADTPNDIIQSMAAALIDRKLGQTELKGLRNSIFPGQQQAKPVKGDPTSYAEVVAVVLLSSRYFQMR